MNKIIEVYKNLEGNKIFETIKVIVISLAIIIPIRTYLMEPFYVKGSSMEPTFHDYDYLLINKLKYRLDEPERGDVVVAKFADNKPYVIKRVIGLPGETIEIKDKKLIITPAEGESYTLDESYVDELNIKNNEEFVIKVPDGQYILLGDNRKVSFDSRQQGAIAKEKIKGKKMAKVLNFGVIANIFN